MLALNNAPIAWRENDGRTDMVTLGALRLAAIVVAHDNPRCMVFVAHHGANMLEGTCWTLCRDGSTELLTEHINPTVRCVRNWLGY